VAVVEEAFLIDPSFGQITDLHPDILVPPVFVGELLPSGGPLRSRYEFSIPGAAVQYDAGSMASDYTASLDWGPSPERDAVRLAIINQIEGYCRVHGLNPPEAAT